MGQSALGRPQKAFFSPQRRVFGDQVPLDAYKSSYTVLHGKNTFTLLPLDDMWRICGYTIGDASVMDHTCPFTKGPL